MRMTPVGYSVGDRVRGRVVGRMLTTVNRGCK